MLKPLKDRVVIKLVKQEEKTTGGLLLPAAAKEKLTFAEVVAVSAFTKEENRQVEVGQVVVFEEYAGTPVKYEGEDYIIIKEDDIIAVVE